MDNELLTALGLEGENEQEAADPASTEEAETRETKPQTDEERHRQAAARRQREREDARAQGRIEARGEFDALLKRLGIQNPNTEKTIETVAELEAYEKELFDGRLENGTANADDIRRVVREENSRKTSQEEINALVAKDIALIHELDPSINSLNDILNDEEIEPDFRRLVNKGLSFEEAFRIAGKNRIEQNLRGQKAAANKAASKDHLTATNTRGEGALSVPDDEMELYRALNPGVSDAEIVKHYNRMKK